MREILFRGKAKDSGEWIESDSILQFEEHPLKKCRVIELFQARGGWVEVIPETVGQYTVLTDKNGKKIFEGDIIAGAAHWLERMKNGVATFRDGSFGLIWYRGDIEQFNPFTSMCNVEYEVIGNIHDTPEVLKGGGE